jgi:hypothetical protein
MIAPSAQMMSLGPLYNRQKLRKLRFLMTDNIWEDVGLQIHRNVQCRIPILYPCKPKTCKQGAETRMENDELTYNAAHFKAAGDHDCGK